jgi:copper/silver efflux system protein
MAWLAFKECRIDYSRTGSGVAACIYWMPLGAGKSLFLNIIFVALMVAVILGAFNILEYYYKSILKWCLDNKAAFLSIPAFLILGVMIWLGFNSIFGFVANGFDKLNVNIRDNRNMVGMVHAFPGTGKEFMPSLDEGSFLLMPTSMPHSGWNTTQGAGSA